MTVRYYPSLTRTFFFTPSANNGPAFIFSVVIHYVNGTHSASSVALIRSLGKRLRDTKRQTYYVHVSTPK